MVLGESLSNKTKVLMGMTLVPTEKSSGNMGLLKHKPAGIDLLCVSTLLF